jgi:hypothetical protein
MRVAVLSDSHGRDIDDEFALVRPDWDVSVLAFGKTLPEIRTAYKKEIVAYYEYAPEVLILHAGHNDVWPHPVHNPRPIHPLICLGRILSLLDEMHEYHPKCRIIYSSILPRAIGPNFGQERKKVYNRMAADYQRSVTELFELEGRRFCTNQSLWMSVPAGMEHPIYYDRRGLHLNTAGRRALTNEWVRAIEDAEKSHV